MSKVIDLYYDILHKETRRERKRHEEEKRLAKVGRAFMPQ